MNEHLILGDYASPGTPALMVQIRAWSIGFSRCSVLLALMNLKGLRLLIQIASPLEGAVLASTGQYCQGKHPACRGPEAHTPYWL